MVRTSARIPLLRIFVASREGAKRIEALDWASRLG